MNNLRDTLINYKEVTLKLYNAVSNGEFELLDGYLGERQNMIMILDNSKFPKEEFKQLIDELKLLEFEEKLNQLMQLKQKEIKANLVQIKTGATANTNYNKRGYADSILFNKKI